MPELGRFRSSLRPDLKLFLPPSDYQLQHQHPGAVEDALEHLQKWFVR